MKTLITLFALVFAIQVQAQKITGSPDSNFNSKGFHFWEVGNGEGLYDVAVDQTGFIWSVGNRFNPDGRVIVTRLQPGGAIDQTFGTNGILEFNPTVNADDYGKGILILDDGTAIIATSNDELNKDIIFFHIMKNGSVDASWGNNGRLVIDESNQDDFRRMILDTDGKVVMVGTTKGNSDNDVLVVRITIDGERDSTFSLSGSQLLDVNSKINTGQDIVERPGGGYYVVSTADDGKSYVNSLSENGNGRLDFNNKTSFAYISGADITQMYNILVDTSGNIVLGGRIDIAGNRDAHIARFKSNGNLDLSFNSTGSNSYFPAPANSNDESIIKMLLQEDGKILFCTQYGLKEYAIFRIKPDGIKDPFFGNGNGFYKGTPYVNTNFFNMNAMAFTGVDSQAIIVGTIYLGPDDYLYYHAFYYNTETPASGGNTSVHSNSVLPIKVYPNPSNGVFNIDIETSNDLEISVYTISGKLVKQQVSDKRIDLRDLDNGLYFMIVKSEDTVYSSRIQLNK